MDFTWNYQWFKWVNKSDSNFIFLELGMLEFLETTHTIDHSSVGLDRVTVQKLFNVAMRIFTFWRLTPNEVSGAS